MGTKFSEVFDEFSMLVDDFRLITLFNTSPENFTTYLSGWLIPAVTDFSKICDQDLTYNLTTKTFNLSLNTRNIVYLARIMKQYWLQRTIDDVSQFQQKIQTDFKTYSEAQGYKLKQDRYTELKEEISTILNQYWYSKDSSWESLLGING